MKCCRSAIDQVDVVLHGNELRPAIGARDVDRTLELARMLHSIGARIARHARENCAPSEATQDPTPHRRLAHELPRSQGARPFRGRRSGTDGNGAGEAPRVAFGARLRLDKPSRAERMAAQQGLRINLHVEHGAHDTPTPSHTHTHTSSRMRLIHSRAYT